MSQVVPPGTARTIRVIWEKAKASLRVSKLFFYVSKHRLLYNRLQRDPAFEKVDFKKVRHCFSKISLIL